MAQQDPSWDERLRAAGLRSTVQRRAVLQALFELRHATVDQLAVAVQRTHPDVNLSTVYRTLDTLEEARLVTHAHLHHGSPTYHSVEDVPHLHLVCTECGRVDQQPIAVAMGLADQLQQAAGFAMDVTHLAVHGRCADCLAREASDSGGR